MYQMITVLSLLLTANNSKDYMHVYYLKKKKKESRWCVCVHEYYILKKGWTPSGSKYKGYDAARCLYDSSQSRSASLRPIFASCSQ